MRSAAIAWVLLLSGCAASTEVLFDKAELAGTWRASMEGERLADVRFVVEESFLLAYERSDDGIDVDDRYSAVVLGWRIDRHVARDGDECRDRSGYAPCLIRDEDSPRWYERSLVDVDWSTTLVGEAGAIYETETLGALDPLAEAERDRTGRLRAFEVPARIADARVDYRFERLD